MTENIKKNEVKNNKNRSKHLNENPSYLILLQAKRGTFKSEVKVLKLKKYKQKSFNTVLR